MQRGHLRPISSEPGAQISGPKANPKSRDNTADGESLADLGFSGGKDGAIEGGNEGCKAGSRGYAESEQGFSEWESRKVEEV